MKSVRSLALGAMGVAVLAYAVSPALAHCGKCAGDCKEIAKAMEAGKQTAATMIAAAETASKGKAVGMMASLDKGKADVHVICMAGDKAQSIPVGTDGKAGKAEDAKGVSADVGKAMDAGKMTAAKVIEAAEAHSKGKALAMVATATGGKASYEVYSLAGDKLQKVKVDDAGKATGMEEAKALPGDVKPAPKGG
jgi:hypothetical protein